MNWTQKHYGHIQVWNTRARSLCYGVRLEGDMSPAHPYFDWYGRVTWRFVDHTTASLLIMVIVSTFLFKFCCVHYGHFCMEHILIVFIYLQVASHKQLLMRHAVGSPEYKQITDVLKVVERLRCITAQLPLEDTDRANLEAPADTGPGRPSTSSTRASHSHGQRATPHQVVSRLGPPPPPHASPALKFPPPLHASSAPEFLPPPHASSSPEIPSHTAHAVPDLEIPLPTVHASFHPEIPSHTPRSFFDPAHLSFAPPSFDLGYDLSQTPPVMHTPSPSYNIGHIDHVSPHSQSMSFMPTPGLHTDPMTTGRTHISSATPSSLAVVGSSVVRS